MDLNDLPWRKSSRSGDNGGDCVELAVLPSGPNGDDLRAGEPAPRPAE